MRYKIQLLVTLYLILTTLVFAQGTSINTDGTEADASAILDVSSTTQGMLLPRMTNTQRLAISSPATGLIIFQIDGEIGLYYYSGSAWTYLAGQAVGTPTITTTSISNIQTTSATSGGNVTDNGGATVTSKGVCWNTTGSPTTSDNTTSDGSGTGSFTSSLTGLNVATTYYVRAYATNSEGTAYGSQENFNTSPEPPTVTTASISDILGTTATSGGNVTDYGGASVTERGVCWSTSGSPTTADSKTSDGTGTGSFTSSITGLTGNTTYYVRSYATNSAGTSYGSTEIFTTHFTVGLSHEGGIVFYVDGTGQHGLIAADSDLSSGIRWDNGSQVSAGSTSTDIGTGNANTNTIVGTYGSGGYAAKICYDLSLNGYTDWYLPSAYELRELKNNKDAVGGLSGTYWSSTQSSSNQRAAYMLMTGSFPIYADTDNSYKVRAIRSF